MGIFDDSMESKRPPGDPRFGPLKPWFAVAFGSNLDEDVWTLSTKPGQTGWETDSGFPGYGLPRAVAEFLAAAANEKLMRDAKVVLGDESASKTEVMNWGECGNLHQCMDYARRIGFVTVLARQIMALAEEQASVGVRGGFSVLREAKRIIEMLETGQCS